jgi:phosphoribosylformylglycinamidine synthase subunit PurQ / glutaminase
MKPKVIVISGYGINGEQEMRQGFLLAGAEQVDEVHVNDLIDGRVSLDDYDILALPGGFSYGDHTGAGKGMANRMLNNLGDQLIKFVKRNTLTFGICNGFQILVQLGLLPALNEEYGTRQAALIHNDSQRYQCEWIKVKTVESPCVFTKGIETLDMPIGHGEGHFYMSDEKLDELEANNLVALRYEGRNPNGSSRDIAGVCDPSGRVFGLMPHPDRSLFFTNLPDWTERKADLLAKGEDLPEFGPGIAIYQNAVNYFS